MSSQSSIHIPMFLDKHNKRQELFWLRLVGLQLGTKGNSDCMFRAAYNSFLYVQALKEIVIACLEPPIILSCMCKTMTKHPLSGTANEIHSQT